MDKKLTDNEIVKALEDCPKNVRNRNCKSCLYTTAKGFCLDRLMEDAFNLINRLQAENEELVGNTDKLKAENERLKEKAEKCFYCTEQANKKIGEVKAEAYKEFADRLKSVYTKDKRYDRPNAHTLIDKLFDNIDNLLKELVGEDDG